MIIKVHPSTTLVTTPVTPIPIAWPKPFGCGC